MLGTSGLAPDWGREGRQESVGAIQPKVYDNPRSRCVNLMGVLSWQTIGPFFVATPSD